MALAVPAQYAVHPVPPPEFNCSEHPIEDARLIGMMLFPGGVHTQLEDLPQVAAVTAAAREVMHSCASGTVSDAANCVSRDYFAGIYSANLDVSVQAISQRTLCKLKLVLI